MAADAVACHVDKLVRDLRVAGIDADIYAQGVFEALECRLPSVLVIEDQMLLDLLLQRLASLYGSLEHGRRLARELRELGVVL